ncbi:MAG: methionyl-tRNA formyltransferase [Candidatus Kerfeldbacteria bacterium]|nr:methionyl-tRNA formyltransferase [Candidatus Kerfeldbacteria bacterium]
MNKPLDAIPLVFFGTPAFAVPSLEALVAAGAGVRCVTAPGKPAGRGGGLTQPPVAGAAKRLGLRCLQPPRLDAVFLDQFRAWQPMVAVVAAYGKIFSPAVLAVPERGFLNIHPSILPRHRGAAPISATILAGDSETGVTIMQLDAGLDTGPTLDAHTFNLTGTETAGSLTEILAHAGADLILETLPRYLEGQVTPLPQPSRGATLTKPLTRDDGRLDFSKPASDLERAVRAYTPWPGAWCLLKSKRLKILAASVGEKATKRRPGTLVAGRDRRLGFVCGDGQLLACDSVQMESKPVLSGREFANGYRSLIGVVAESTG